MQLIAESVAGKHPGRWVSCKQVYAITVGLVTVSARPGAIIVTWQQGDENVFARFSDIEKAKALFSALSSLTN